MLVALAFSGSSLANPTGPSVVSGMASFSSVGNSLNVTNSPNAIINWRGFSIGASETTRFVQQSAASSVLNRVVGRDPSAILGTLSSNGRVFLINPNGILFGAGSRVDVAGLVASTLNITDQDFLAGRLNFQSGAVANPILNYGRIATPAGGRVYLIAPDIENHGVITTPQGQTVLAAGKSAQLVEADVPNLRVEIQAGGTALNVGRILADGGSAGIYAGLIRQQGIVRADSVARNETGNIVFRASGQTMLEAGSVTSASGERGGRIEITGEEVGLVGNARVEATGRQGGGTVLIGGDYQGKNADVQNARATYIGPDATIDASATQSGDGGKVIVWSEEATRVYGAINARGGAESGNGGFVETSGHYLEVTRAPDVSAPSGSGGTWLLDPYNIEVVAGSGVANNSGVPSFAPNNNDSQVGANLINGQLDANANVVLDTGGPGSQVGDITVSSGITKSVSNNASLTLNAANSVTINAPINLSPGGGNFNVTTGSTSGTMTVNNAVTAGGAMNLNLAGGLVVQSTAAQFAELTANTGQTITARSIAVTVLTGFSASIKNNTSGNQNITVNNANVGTGISILNNFASFAGIQSSGTGTQTITVNNADFLRVSGVGSTAQITASGDQTIQVTGTGLNAIQIGAAANTGSSFVRGNNQSITAGTGVQNGSITLTGPAADSRLVDLTSQLGGTQTISTTGALTISAGTAPTNGFSTSISNNFNGLQHVTANSVALFGGATGTNNRASISAFAGQTLDVGSGGLTLTGGSGAGGGNSVNIGQSGATAAQQTINLIGGGNILITGGANGNSNNAGISNSGGNQLLDLSAGGNLTMQGGSSGTNNGAFLSQGSPITPGTQTLLANTGTGIFLTGGTGTATSSGSFISAFGISGGQTINAGSGGITINGGTATGGNSGAGISQNSTTATQSVTVNGGNVSLLGGTGAATNSVNIGNSGTAQTINVNNAASISVVAQTSSANITSSGNQTVTIQGASSANALTVGGALSASLSYISGNNQSVTAGTAGQSGSITEQGGIADATNTGIFSSSGPQTVSTTGMLSITAGTQPNTASTFGAEASVYNTGTGPQTVSAKGISLQGGSIGSTNVAFVQSNGSQSVTVGTSGISLTGGSGGASATDNFAQIFQNAATGTSQTVTVNGGGSITMVGGSSAKTNVGSAGHGSRTFIGANGDSQQIDFTAGGAIALTGGTNGSRNFAEIFLCSSQGPCAPNGTQTITGAPSITLTGGASGGISGEGNLAGIFGYTGLQSITAGPVLLTGGANGTSNYAQIYNPGGQTIVAPSITLTGGADGGGIDTGNFASIQSNASQSITVGSGGLTMTGGSGALTQNFASIFQGGLAGTSETITVNGGGAVTLRGGSSAQSGIGSTVNGSYAFITADGDSQQLSFTAPGSAISITGGTVGSRNNAGIHTRTSGGTQTITGSPTITMIGGASGGVAGEGNFALLRADLGAQNITAGAVVLSGGANGTSNFAQIRSGAAQIFVAPSIVLTGGAGGGGFGTGNFAQITSDSGQSISVGSGGLTMTGGSGPLTDNYASVFQGGLAGTSQLITVGGGGAITLHGGSSAQSGIGTVSGHGSYAYITADGDSQQISFTAPGSAISLTGGTVGSRNSVGIHTRTGGSTQTITGTTSANSPSITLTGGASGGVDLEGNSAILDVDLVGGTQTITADGVTLNAGAGGINNYAVIQAPAQFINVHGDLAIKGGGSSATATTGGGAAIGGRGGSTPTPTNLTLNVDGNLTLTGGTNSGSGANIGSGFLGGQTTDITMNVGGNITLNPGTVSGARIGSPSGAVAGGDVAVTAGGNIALNSSGGVGTSILTTGNVTLHADAAGKSISEGVDSLIQANALAATANSGIALNGNNVVTNLNASNTTSGGIQFTEAAGNKLTVTGMSQTGGNIIVTADDLDITGAVNAGANSVTLRPTTLSQTINIESGPTGGVMSLSPSELGNVTAGTLEIGRSDGTGDVNVNTTIANSNINAGTVRVLAGNNVNLTTAADMGSSGTPFNHHLELKANNNVFVTNGNVYLADNRNLTIAADNDSSGVGDVNFGGVVVQVGTGAGNTTGSMSIQGRNIAMGSSGGPETISVTGAGTQTFTAFDQISINNSANSSVTISTASGLQKFDTSAATGSGNLMIQSSGSGGANGQVTVQSVTGAQNINLNGGLTVKSVAGGSSSATATLSADAGQTISAKFVESLAGGLGGANIINVSFGTQSITTSGMNASNQGLVVSNTGAVAGGARIQSAGSGAQMITVNNASEVDLLATGGDALITSNAGDQTLLVTGAASNNAINVGSAAGTGLASMQGANQSVTAGNVGQSGSITVLGGNTDGKASRILSITGTQTITTPGTVTITGGTAPGVAGPGACTVEGACAVIQNSGNGLQSVSAGDITMTGGASGGFNNALLLAFGTGAQSVSARSITLTGGSGSVGGNGASIQSTSDQAITVGAGGITLIGGAGLVGNHGLIRQSGTVGTQHITVNGGGTIDIRGGSSTDTVAATAGSNGDLRSDGTLQQIDFTSGGQLKLTGGTIGNGNQAFVRAESPGASQVITGSPTITLTGGASGGSTTDGNEADIFSDGSQNISAASISAMGGAGGINTFAGVRAVNDQIITVGSGGITLIGGSGLGSAHAQILQTGAGEQSITFNAPGGAISLTGGTGDTPITATAGNLAQINATSGNQTIAGNVTANNPSITINAGPSGNNTFVSATNTNIGNNAFIRAQAGTQNISAGAIQVNAGAAGIDNSATIQAPHQNITASSVTLTGGGASGSFAGARTGGIGGGTPGPTDLHLTTTGTGNVVLNGGSVSGVTIGTNSVGGVTTDIVINSGGDVTLNAGIGGRAFIGSSNAVAAGGDISVTAGGNIALNATGSVGTAIRTAGNVTLHADTAGKSITEAANSVIAANTLTTSSNGATSLLGTGNAVSNFVASTVGGNITFNNAQALTLGSGWLTTPAGAQTVNITTTGATSDITLSGSTTTDDNVSLTSGRDIFLNGPTLGANSLTLNAPTGGIVDGNGAANNVSATTLSLGAANGIVLDTAVANLSANNTGTGNVVFRNTGSLAISGVGAAGGGTATITATGTITLNGAVSATGAGDSIVLASGGNFVNNAGASALSPGSGRWLVYSANPTLDTLGGLASNFKQYNATYGVTSVLGTGNGLLYSLAPVITPGLTGSVTKAYDGTTVAALLPANYTATGAIGGDTVTLNNPATGSFDTKHAGVSKTVTASGLAIASATNGSATVYGYQLGSASASAAIGTVTAVPLTVGLSNTGVTKSYDGTTAAPAGFTPVYSVSGLIAGDAATISNSGSAYNSAHVASANTLSVNGLLLTSVVGSNASLASDYSFGASSASVAATITAAPLTASLTNTGVTKSYDGTTAAPAGFTPAFSVSGLVSGDTAATISNTGRAYNSAHVASATTVAVSGLSLTGITGANASLASDYSLGTPSASVTATITRAPLAVSLTNVSVAKAYDGTSAAPAGFTPAYSVTGFATGDSGATITNGAASYNSAHVAGANTVSVAGLALTGITGSLGSATTDYSVPASTNVAASITPASLTVALTNTGVTKAYDATINAPAGFTPSFSVSGLVAGDTAATIGSTSRTYNNANVVGATTLTASGLSIGGVTGSAGSVASDYSVPASAGTGATITAAPLSLTLVGPVTKTYDGTTAATLAPANFNLTGFVGTESASVTQSAGTYASPSAGSGIDVSATLATGNYSPVGGTILTNYVLPGGSFTGTGIGTINPALLSVSVALVGPVSKVYDGTTVATLMPANFSLSGFVASDSASINQTLGSYATANAGGGNNVSTTLATGNYVAGGSTQLGNYSLQTGTLTGTGIGTINKAALTVSTGNVTKTYDGTLAAPGAAATVTGGTLYANASNGNALDSLLAGTFAFTNAHAGIGNKTVSVAGVTVNDGNAGGNYNVTLVNNTSSTINKAALTVNAVGASKVYDGTTSSTGTPTTAGLVGGDTVSALSESYASKNVLGLNASTLNVNGGFVVNDGNAGNNYSVLTNSAAGTITPKSISAAGLAANNKVYDGNTTATLNVGGANLSGAVAGDAISLNPAAATGTFADRNVGTGNLVTVNGLTLAGADAPNYTLAASGSVLSANITQLPSVTWTGGASGNWSVAANWAGGALPDASNVAQVVIPPGSTVNYDLVSGATTLNTLSSSGTLNMSVGALGINSSLNTARYQQTGGSVSGSGTFGVTQSFSQTGGSINMGGTLSITQSSGSLAINNSIAASAITLAAPTGAITEPATASIGTGQLTTSSSGAMNLLGTGNQIANLDVTAGGAVTVVNASALNVTGISTGANPVTLTAGGAISQSGAITSTGLLITSSLGGTGLPNSGNAFSTVNATNTGVGDIALTSSTGTLTVSGINQGGGGDVSVRNLTGAITTTGAITAPGSNNLVALDAGNGSITVGAGINAANVSLEAFGAASDVLINANVAASLGDVFVSADRKVVLGSGGISAISGNATLAALGGTITESAAGIISSAVLDTFSTGTTTLGNANAVGSFSAVTSGGNVSFTNGTGFVLNGVSAPGSSVSLNAGGPIGSGAGGVQANVLAAAATGGLNLGSGNLVNTVNLTNSGSGAVVLGNAAPLLTVAGVSQTGGGVTIGNTGAIATSGPIGASGDLLMSATGSFGVGAPISAGGNLGLFGAVLSVGANVSSGAGALTASAGTGLLNVVGGSTITGGGGLVSLFGGDMNIGGTVNAGAGTVVLNNTSGGIVTLGGGASGFGLSNTELGRITAGTLILNGSPIMVDGAVSLTLGQVVLNGSSIDFANSFTVSGGNLVVNVGGGVTVTPGASPVDVRANGISITGGTVMLDASSGSHALIAAGAGGATINAGSGKVTLLPGIGPDANAGIIATGPVVMNGFSCTGCAVLTTDPFSSPPVLAATGLFGSSVSVTILAPVLVENLDLPQVVLSQVQPPQVLPPAQPQTPPPPSAEDSDKKQETSSGSTQNDDGSATRKRRVPRCG